MKNILFLFALISCASKSSNAIEELGEEVLKKKEGIDIELIPMEEKKGIHATIFRF